MAKELVYLGEQDGMCRVALLNLGDFSTRTVPVKMVKTSELRGLVQSGRVKPSGFGNPLKNMDSNALIRVGVVEVVIDRAYDNLFKINCFLTRDGAFRFYHPKALKALIGTRRVFMRQNVTIIRAASFADVHGEEADYPEIEQSSEEAFYQKLLLHGVYADVDALGTGQLWGSGEVFIERLSVPKKVDGLVRMLSFAGVNLRVGEMTVEDKVSVRARGHQTGTLHVGSLRVGHGTDFGTDPDCGYVTRVVGSGAKIWGLTHYTGVGMLCEARQLTLEQCFFEDKVDGDVFIPDGSKVNASFIRAEVSGTVTFGSRGCRCVRSFESARVGRVALCAERVELSFNCGEIYGDVNATETTEISQSFQGRIGGSVILSDKLNDLLGKCFTKAGLSEVAVYARASTIFRTCAGLQLERAKMTVYGDAVSFSGADVAELVWETETIELGEFNTFGKAHIFVTKPVPTIQLVKNGAFLCFHGAVLDFRLLPNLNQIETRAVADCEELQVAVIAGSTQLSPSSFIRCPRLDSVYIGDEVTGVTASVFDNCAPIVTIYYGKNPALAKLARLPRFKLVPDSAPEDAFSAIRGRQERLETAEAIANLAGVGREGSSAVVRAAELALSETGFSDRLPQIIPRCDVPVQTLYWARRTVNAQAYGSVRDEAALALFGALTQTYPYCAEVLTFKAENRVKGHGFEMVRTTEAPGGVALSAAGYTLIKRTFKVSGTACWAYVLVDDSQGIIIHAFTVGFENTIGLDGLNDDLSEIVAFLNNTSKTTLACAVLRYAEEVNVIGSLYSEFADAVRPKIYAGFMASWVPFGVFKIQGKTSVLGVDLYCGDIVGYHFKSNSAARTPLLLRDFTRKFELLAFKYTGDLVNLKPIRAGYGDSYVARIAASARGLRVSEYDHTRIPLAQGDTAKQLLSAFTDGTATAADCVRLLNQSEAVRACPRTRLYTPSVGLTKLPLADGFIEDGSEVIRVYSDTEDNTFALPCRLNVFLNILRFISAADKTVTDEHCALEVSVKSTESAATLVNLGDILLLSTRAPGHSLLAKPGMLSVGISKKSFKACLCAMLGDITAVLFWFNSLTNAYRAAGILRYSPFSFAAKALHSHTSGMQKMEADGTLTKGFVSCTQDFIRAGHTDGYVMQASVCNQGLFDLACKQPKTI
ncbi:hypothetical protein FACS1894208_02120 [Clostridia bacterium]|nr:hypothetical protein FACS1894208_02120 [Clostridia bacterium]